jgi:tetratricopeptide (TPR) repeat protein
MTQARLEQDLARAVAAHNAKRLDEAEAIYRRIVAEAPDHAGALHLLGVLTMQTSRHAEAAELLARAATIAPSIAQFHHDLSRAQTKLGCTDHAIASIRRAIALQADLAEAHNELGVLLTQMRSGDTDADATLNEAIASFRQALVLRPHFLQARSNLASTLAARGCTDEAISELRQVIGQNPDYAHAHNNLGSALVKAGRDGEAIDCYRRAIALAPAYAQAHYNLANSLKNLARFDEAVLAYEQAIAINGQFADAHWNLGLLLLLCGSLARGLIEFEWRHKASFGRTHARKFSQPAWDDSALDGQRILVYAEQGFGDVIHMIRYVPLLAEQGATVIIECQSALWRLLAGQRFPGVQQVIAQGDAVGEFDAHCAVMSLPLRMGTSNLAGVPGAVPYLSADSEIAGRWKARIGSDRRMHVGLAWAGSSNLADDRNRSMTAATLTPLGEIPGVRFVSLQKNDRTAYVTELPQSFSLTDWTAELTDFAETAGLIANLDLVICVDTAVAHLAGAMGKPVWVLLPRVPDWRWMLDRDDSPWYPTMRLFRQEAKGDWNGPIERVVTELRRHAPQRQRS